MYRIVPRTEIGLPATVTSSNGSPRPLLKDCTYMTAHYTGVSRSYVGADVPSQIRLIQAVFAATKPFEYNYVIGLPDDDNVYEFAGHYRAAHSGGENSTAVGVLFLVGVDDVVTSKMIDKWRWLRGELAKAGIVSWNVDQRMHFQMPGAATACPGDSIKQQWASFLTPYSEPEVPVEEDMKYIATPPPGYPPSSPWLLVWDGAVRYCTTEDTKYGLKMVPLNKEQYDFLRRCAGV